MKSERDKTSLGVMLVTALTSLLVACATQGDEVDVDDDGTASADVEPGAADLRVAPPAPDDAASTPAGHDKEDGSSFVASPTISPSDSAPGADVQFAPAGGTYSCASGTFCAGVWDPNAGQWKVFKLFFCTTYALSNWNGSGFYFDNQTAGTQTFFYDQFHIQINKNAIFPGPQVNYNWDPVWFIKNC